jgi:hypothetical protein
LIFRNPTSRIKVGQNEYAVLQPLLPEQVERSVAAALTPAARLVLALAAVHAARVARSPPSCSTTSISATAG